MRQIRVSDQVAFCGTPCCTVLKIEEQTDSWPHHQFYLQRRRYEFLIRTEISPSWGCCTSRCCILELSEVGATNTLGAVAVEPHREEAVRRRWSLARAIAKWMQKKRTFWTHHICVHLSLIRLEIKILDHLYIIVN